MACPPTVRRGSSGQVVSDLQRRLNAFGASLVVDGAFGSATHTAVVSFQRSRGLAQDGVVGPMTWSALGAC